MRKYFIHRHRIFLAMIGVVTIARYVQVIFAILHDPAAPSYLLISGGEWTRSITQTGYRQSWRSTTSTTEPNPLAENIMQSFQDKCRYGVGQCIAFAHQHLIASLSRLQTIQHISQEANLSQATDITNRLSMVTTLAPHRVYPYSFAVLMWPAPRSSITNNTRKEKDLTRITWENAVTIGEVWIRMTCDPDKIDATKSLSPTEFISAVHTKDLRYRWPCPDYRLPQILAFNYYHYLGDAEQAIQYYKIAAMHDDVPSISIKMPAILARQYGITTLYK